MIPFESSPNTSSLSLETPEQVAKRLAGMSSSVDHNLTEERHDDGSVEAAPSKEVAANERWKELQNMEDKIEHGESLDENDLQKLYFTKNILSGQNKQVGFLIERRHREKLFTKDLAILFKCKEDEIVTSSKDLFYASDVKVFVGQLDESTAWTLITKHPNVHIFESIPGEEISINDVKGRFNF